MAGVIFSLTVDCGQGGSPTMSQQVRIVDEQSCSYETGQGEGLKTFGEVNFGDAELGDVGIRAARCLKSSKRPKSGMACII